MFKTSKSEGLIHATQAEQIAQIIHTTILALTDALN